MRIIDAHARTAAAMDDETLCRLVEELDAALAETGHSGELHGPCVLEQAQRFAKQHPPRDAAVTHDNGEGFL